MRILSIFSSVLLFGAACQPLPQTPSSDGLAVFVVGDSWAEFTQGTVSAYSTDNMVATHLQDLGFTIDSTHAFGRGGTAATFWQAGIPCSTPGDSCADDMLDEQLFLALETSPSTPFVYLSLGGNDIRVAGGLVDLNDPAQRDVVLGNTEDALFGFVDAILTTRPDATVVIPGYTNFHFDGEGLDGAFTCQELFDTALPATPAPTAQLVNSLFSEGEIDGDPIPGLYGIYRSLEDTWPDTVFFEGRPHLFTPDPVEPWSPSPPGTMVDCLHLEPTLHRTFVDATLDAWSASR